MNRGLGEMGHYTGLNGALTLTLSLGERGSEGTVVGFLVSW